MTRNSSTHSQKEKEKSEAPVSTDNQEKAESVKKGTNWFKRYSWAILYSEPKTEGSDDPAVGYTAVRSAPRGKSSGDQVVRWSIPVDLDWEKKVTSSFMISPSVD